MPNYKIWLQIEEQTGDGIDIGEPTDYPITFNDFDEAQAVLDGLAQTAPHATEHLAYLTELIDERQLAEYARWCDEHNL